LEFKPMQPLHKIALVTGGARRLGRAIALDLAAAGWDIAVHFGNSAADAARTVDLIKQMGRRAIALQADLADEAAVDTLIERCAAGIGVPDCLVNNASLFDFDVCGDFQWNNLERHMRVNAAAPVSLARDLHRLRRAQGSADARPGVVINLLDQKLSNPNPDFLSYTLSKSALQQATVLLAQALAPELRVVGVAPGITMPSGNQTDAQYRAAHALTPLGKSSLPADVSAAVVYLASAHAVTGTTLLVDGGQHLHPSERDVMFLVPGSNP
jgi:hypothetical protein